MRGSQFPYPGGREWHQVLGIVPNQHCHASHICHYTFSSSHIKKKKYGEISLNNSLFSPVCPKYCHFNMSIYCLRHQAFYTYSTSQFRQTSFLVLSNHMWLRATVMDTAGLSHHSGLWLFPLPCFFSLHSPFLILSSIFCLLKQ